MPITVSEVGGLAVAFHPATQQTIERELRALDPGLFLDPEYEPNGPYGPFIYMTVKHHVGSAVPPVPVLEWRDRDGPWPLTLALVERVKRMEVKDRAAAETVKRAVAANDRIRQQTIATVGEQSYDVVMQGGKQAAGLSSAVLPRSQALRRSRDRQRSQGHKV